MTGRFYFLGIVFIKCLLINSGLVESQSARERLANALRHSNKYSDQFINKNATIFLSLGSSDKDRIIDLIFGLKGRIPEPNQPQLITLDEGEDNETVLFDYPEFSKAGYPHENILYHEMIMQSVSSVKIIFTMRHFGEDDDFEESLIELGRWCSDLFPKAKHFSWSFGLLITRIPESLRYPKQQVYPNSEDAIYLINVNGNRISKLYDKLLESNWTLYFKSYKEFNNTMIFLNSILRVEKDVYSRIFVASSNYDYDIQNVKSYLRSFVEEIPFSQVVEIGNELATRIMKSMSEDLNESVRLSVAAVAEELIGKYTMANDNTLDLENDYRKFNITRYNFLDLGKNISTVEEFVRKLITVIKDLGLNISSRKLQLSLEEKDIFPILGQLMYTDIELPLHWFSGLYKFIDHLIHFEKWAYFLKTLFTELPRSVFLYDRMDSVKELLNNLYTLKEGPPIEVGDIGFLSLFQKTDANWNTNLINSYNAVAKMIVKKVELLPLITTLEQFGKEPKVKCPSGKNITEITGVFVKSSDILKAIKIPCVQPVELIEVMAFNSIIFDDDRISLDGNETTLAMIAPQLVAGGSPITLNGKSGENPEPRKEDTKAGTDGEAGKPGGPGGNFFGLAGRMYGSLFVQSNGGPGGDGQDGVDGAKGEDGRFVENDNEDKFDYSKLSDYSYYWSNESKTYYFPDDDGKTFYECHHYNFIYNNTKKPETYFTWRVSGTEGMNGTKGGDGGQGGEGGIPGTITFIELSQGGDSNWTTMENGTSGNSGKGGKGGKGGESGKILSVRCRSTLKYKCSKVGEMPKIVAPNGEGGLTNSTKGKQPKKKPAEYKPYTTINKFKSAVREHLKESIDKIGLLEFTLKLELNPSVINLYDHISLIDELKSIEEQYYGLYKDVDFLPFYESLLSRIELYAQKGSKDRDIQLAILSVYTAAFSKISMLKNKVYGFMIVDVQHSLSKIVQEISVIEKLGKELMISNYAKEYTEEINEEIKTSEDVMEQQLMPEIDNLFKEIKVEMQTAIRETEQLQKAGEFQKQEIERQKEIQKQALIKKILLGAIAAVGAIAGALFPGFGVAIAIGTAAIGTAVAVAYDTGEEHLGEIKDSRQDFFKKFPKASSDPLGFAKLSGNYRKLMLDQIEDVIKKAGEVKGPKTDNIINKMKERLNSIRNDIVAKAEATASDIMNFKDKAISEIKSTYATFQDDLKGFKSPLQAVSRFKGAAIGILSNAVSMATDVMDYRSNTRELEAEGEMIDRQCAALMERKKDLINVMDNVVKDVADDVKTALNDLSGKKSVEITASKWDMSKKMGDVKLHFNKMLEGADAGQNIQHILKKVETLIDTIMTMYEKIEKNNNQKKFAELQSNLASSRNQWDVGDRALFQKLNEMSFAIRTSNVLVQYDRALHALKQYVFPFAHHFLQEFSTPSSLKMSDDFKDILGTIIPQVQKLYSSLDDWIRNINHHDKIIFQNVYFTETYNRPFYIVNYTENKRMIQNLLKGEPILINADIKNGIDKDAVKFNKMQIKLNLIDKSKQDMFSRAISHFDVELTHYGYNYYRCGTNNYVIKSEKQIIIHSFRENEEGLPLRVNVVYDKMSKGGYYLSPYGLWSVRLRNKKSSFHLLQDFIQEPIDIHFQGRGQYVKESKLLTTTCQTQMKEYYTQSDEYAQLDKLLIKAMD